MILKVPVNHGGRLFAAGDSVAGKLPLDYIELLRKNGHLAEEEQVEALAVSQEDPEFDLNASASEVIKHIAEVESQEELDRINQLEREKDSPRSTVLKAIDKRYEELELLANSQTFGKSDDE